MAYLIDADVFIRAKNLHYGFDLCPGFWDWIAQANEDGRVFSIEKVQDEIKAVEDELSEWAAAHADLFLTPSQDTVAALGEVADWVANQDYTPTAIDTFLQVADYYLIAEAVARDHDVVTHEIPANSVNRVKIPNVCIGLGVKCLTPFEMLNVEHARFVLETPEAGL